MQNEKQLISNVTDSLNDALNSLRGNQFTNVGIYIKEALTFLRKASEPATPAPMPVFSENQLLDMAAVEKLNYAMRPIAAQTEKVCAWDVIGNECDCSDCKSASAEQADAARLDNLLEKVASVAKAFHAQPKHGSPADKQLIVEMEEAAASLKQETQPPSNFSFHLAHILDICYFNPSIESHGCMPDETGRCMVAACACRCHFAPAPADTGAAALCGEELDHNGVIVHCNLPEAHEAPCFHYGAIPLASTGDTPQPQEAEPDILERLKSACNGHPYAKIPWPHYVLHDAMEEIIKLRAALGKTPDAREWLNKYWPLSHDGGRLFHRDIMVRVLEEYASTLPAREAKEK